MHSPCTCQAGVRKEMWPCKDQSKPTGCLRVLTVLALCVPAPPCCPKGRALPRACTAQDPGQGWEAAATLCTEAPPMGCTGICLADGRGVVSFVLIPNIWSYFNSLLQKITLVETADDGTFYFFHHLMAQADCICILRFTAPNFSVWSFLN